MQRDKIIATKSLLNTEYTITLLKVFLGIFALFASAQISIPIKPVAITLHTVIISLIGLTYTPRLSFITVLFYIILGALGLPMFSKLQSGVLFLLGATGGYYLGFLIATPIISLTRRALPDKLWGVMLCCLVGHFIIYFFGVSWLATIIGLKQAIYSGFIIYIPTGLVKIAVFSYIFSYINNKAKS